MLHVDSSGAPVSDPTVLPAMLWELSSAWGIEWQLVPAKWPTASVEELRTDRDKHFHGLFSVKQLWGGEAVACDRLGSSHTVARAFTREAGREGCGGLRHYQTWTTPPPPALEKPPIWWKVCFSCTHSASCKLLCPGLLVLLCPQHSCFPETFWVRAGSLSGQGLLPCAFLLTRHPCQPPAPLTATLGSV